MESQTQLIKADQDIPKWIRVKDFNRRRYKQTVGVVSEFGLNTVCKSANCPNRYECFSCGHATFMILGDVCTRRCRYCNVANSKGLHPDPVDNREPKQITQAVKQMGIKYAVITSVTRDDLPDGGASQFVKVIKEIRKKIPGCGIEVLVPDFRGNKEALNKIILARPDVLNHNIEVAKKIFPVMRPQGSYKRSIALLKNAKALNKLKNSKVNSLFPTIPHCGDFNQSNIQMLTKSGLMIGLGETISQVIETAKELRKAGVDIITIGQYLAPSSAHAKVKKYYTPKEFNRIKKACQEMGFSHVEAGPMIRSSYMAEGMVNQNA